MLIVEFSLAFGCICGVAAGVLMLREKEASVRNETIPIIIGIFGAAAAVWAYVATRSADWWKVAVCFLALFAFGYRNRLKRRLRAHRLK